MGFGFEYVNRWVSSPRWVPSLYAPYRPVEPGLPLFRPPLVPWSLGTEPPRTESRGEILSLPGEWPVLPARPPHSTGQLDNWSIGQLVKTGSGGDWQAGEWPVLPARPPDSVFLPARSPFHPSLAPTDTVRLPARFHAPDPTSLPSLLPPNPLPLPPLLSPPPPLLPTPLPALRPCSWHSPPPQDAGPHAARDLRERRGRGVGGWGRKTEGGKEKGR